MRALIYCRTSSDDEAGEQSSIPTQEKDCIELAKRESYEVIETILEPNRSGRCYPTGEKLFDADLSTQEYVRNFKYKTRDGLTKVLKLLPNVDMVIVRDFTRLARPIETGFLLKFLIQQFNRNKVRIHTVTATRYNSPVWDWMPDDRKPTSSAVRMVGEIA
jgi:DNA invertase Pin-like site-specific DNA recombinase